VLDEDILNLKDRYQNGYDNIGKDFLGKCLKECSRYRRGTAFFSSSALMSWADAMDHLINEKVKIEILCSPVVSDRRLIETLANNKSAELRKKTLQDLSDQIILLATIGFKQNNERNDYRSKLLSYLIASEQLEFRFAIPKNYNFPEEKGDERNLYHVKVGYFTFSDGNVVAFEGSVNESDSAHQYNYESTQVFKNWLLEDKKRANNVISSIDADWDSLNPHLEIYKLSDSIIKKIKEHSPERRPIRGDAHAKPSTQNQIQTPKPETNFSLPEKLWQHQKDAINTFLDLKTGILEMATGTGKTVTALEVVRQLYVRKVIDSIVICTYGTDLLNQWHENVEKWISLYPDSNLENLKIFKQYDKFKDLRSFLNASSNSLLIISRDADNLLQLLTSNSVNWGTTLIIHDEIHGFGSPALVKALKGLHGKIPYRLGLSATPERIYDQEGSNFIEAEVGNVIFKYPLELAIEDGILCEFTYVPIEFDLQTIDRDGYQKVYARKASDAMRGDYWDSNRLATELSKIVKKASLKPFKLHEHLASCPDDIKSSIIFVLDTEQGNSICSVVNQFTHRYKTYYAGTESEYISLLANSEIDTLVACTRLNEGVDIKQLNTVILVSSDRARLDTIQRIGRCLRKDPNNLNKVAKVIDFVLINQKEGVDNSDQLRKEWLQKISQCKKKKDI
jgi:superfamily II DNA or RNA helicase